MGVADILFQRKQELAAKNLKEGQDFMEENGKKDGVLTLENGLQYEVLVEGNGPKPNIKSTVKCHYHGTTIHGEVFDSSVKRGTPATFPLNRVIAGWTVGVQLMSVGSKYRFVIPAWLAYGEEQISKEIGPNSTLIFEVELLGIQ